MFRTLSSMHTQWTSRVLLPALVLLGGSLTAAAAPPAQEKQDAKEASASFRAYLPTIRLKALRDNERQSVADLENWLRKYELWLVGGAVNLIQSGQIEEEYHRSRLRALRLDTDYRDSLDQFTSRFRVSEERRRQMEDAAISAIVKVFQRFEEFSRDFEAPLVKVSLCETIEDAAKLRPVLIKLLTESALVKNTTLPKRFLRGWDECKKIEDRNKAMDRIIKTREDIDQLRKRLNEFAEKQQNLPETDKQRMDALKFDIDLGEFQLALLICGKQPWKNIKDDAARLRSRREIIYGLSRIVKHLLDYSYIERLTRLDQSWPRLAPVKVKSVDLLNCKRDKAEETVASLLKTPDVQRIGGKQIRRLRTLAESYPIQQRLFRIGWATREELRDSDKSPSPPPGDLASDVVLPGQVGPMTTRPQPQLTALKPEPLLKTEALFARAKRHLLQTWIDYQMLRLDLFDALSVAPPEW